MRIRLFPNIDEQVGVILEQRIRLNITIPGYFRLEFRLCYSFGLFYSHEQIRAICPSIFGGTITSGIQDLSDLSAATSPLY